ncbi:DUF3224 domain-containing protein [Streptomyces sp. LP05-1]|uniref:DUF3224 domain-containing protein n=1 Tax=Streptomyces pyxinae TaxID=2970734 RepID=A0ABT2CSS7_9ACTN|nr:DUF3224 domain-containing protein [Streptomyces sp. LP05-1]MCS0639736.1 DUF3224 domain-containing protein [Streptomyces sp. LP05-1]
MRASGIFTVHAFVPADPAPVPPPPPVDTALPVGVSTMEKRYEGEVTGRSTTLLTGAYDPATQSGTYVAMESFEGTLNGRSGTFNFAHSKSSLGPRVSDEFFVLVPGSGTGELAGISGSGELVVEEDGTHRIRFAYELG